MWGGELIGRYINEAIGIPFIYENKRVVLNLGGWIRFQNLGPSRPLLLPGPGMIEGVFEIFINYYYTMIQNSKFIFSILFLFLLIF